MDFFGLIIILAIACSVIGGIIWVMFFFFLGKTVVKSIAKSLEEFQRMDISQQFQTLMYLQQTNQFQRGRQYMDSLEGPVTSEIRSMAASEGISLDF